MSPLEVDPRTETNVGGLLAEYVAAEDICVGCGNGPLSILDKHHGQRCNCCRNGHSRMYVTYDTKFRPRGAYCSECLTPLQRIDGPALSGDTA